VVDFTRDILELVDHPPHGFGVRSTRASIVTRA
jgi:peroxiredoxin